MSATTPTWAYAMSDARAWCAARGEQNGKTVVSRCDKGAWCAAMANQKEDHHEGVEYGKPMYLNLGILGVYSFKLGSVKAPDAQRNRRRGTA